MADGFIEEKMSSLMMLTTVYSVLHSLLHIFMLLDPEGFIIYKI